MSPETPELLLHNTFKYYLSPTLREGRLGFPYQVLYLHKKNNCSFVAPRETIRSYEELEYDSKTVILVPLKLQVSQHTQKFRKWGLGQGSKSRIYRGISSISLGNLILCEFLYSVHTILLKLSFGM